MNYTVIVDGQTQQGTGLPLVEAARRVADARRRGARIEARVVLPVGGWRLLSHLETKTLAEAAAIELTRGSR
jgi:hypothetical protein